MNSFHSRRDTLVLFSLVDHQTTLIAELLCEIPAVNFLTNSGFRGNRMELRLQLYLKTKNFYSLPC